MTLSPAPLMRLALGFWNSKTLATAHELDLFTRLSDGAGTTPDELAADLEIHPRPAGMLLVACASLGLLDVVDGRYRNSALAEEFLVRGRPNYLGGWLRMVDTRVRPGWDRLTEAVRTNQPTTWDTERQDTMFDAADPLMAEFWEGLYSASRFTARALADAVDLGGFRRLLDVGGGYGAFDVELCLRYPDLRATVFDLDFVCETTRKKAAEAGLADRVEAVGGDFFVDDLPGGHDLLLLSMILHDWDEERNRAILRRCHDALEPGGQVMVCELLVDEDGTGPANAAMMSLNMLVETHGRNYTASEYGAWLREAGFEDVRTVRFESVGANGVVLGRKPGRP
ncbi:methyltransferase [Streptoalloteichus hindustanus]|uniref:Ubiquinone/menaquinone biosynthesis C-methylase UbiE n=1 Tax=Streptoalloteichus hindustanus TaxID=2017 RepID=A0A1M4UWG1_STRHI|nr:methyltransferase [Streptoalloteichus hindustanus]SHE60989.1 Ubiquinone/menaquinone biosynthesis C-methylase UbiE [Streptoalloteichus hindustanus]